MRAHSEKTVIYKPESGPSPDPESAHTLVLDLWPVELWEDQSPLFKLHRSLEFCHGNWANSHPPHLFLIFFPISSNFVPPTHWHGPQTLHPTPPSLFVHLSPLFYLSISNLSSIHPSISQYIHLCIISIYYLSICASIIYLSQLSTYHLSVYLSLYLSTDLPVNASVYPQ